MTNKELSYVEDALGHETFMKTCSQKTSSKHTEIFNKFFNLL